MRRFEGEIHGKLMPGGTCVGGFVLDDCDVNACAVGVRTGGELSEICDGQVRRTTIRGAYLFDTVLRNINVDGLKVLGPQLMLTGCYFDRVTLRDCVGPVTISPRGYPGRISERLAGFYDTVVEFALDVSGADRMLELRSVPPRVVRIDPERQAFVEASKLPADWRRVADDEEIAACIEGGLAHQEAHVFVTASKAGERAALRRLNERGCCATTGADA